ncbi:MAG: recombinase family protein [Oscillospiraceae bacterium]|nr:recombinase family protein [Oscillospiraceae bacterium]
MIRAYTRVSTNKESQKHDRQKKALADYAMENGFEIDLWHSDTISGKTNADSRPKYMEMKQNLARGDVLLVSDLDRLGRDASNIIVELKDLQAKGIKVVALDIPYMNNWTQMNDDSISAMIIDILVTLKAHLAQQELEKTKDRINQGLSAAKAKGIKLGRPQVILSREFTREYRKFKNGEYGKMSATAFAKTLGIGRATLYKYASLYEAGVS